MKIVIAGSSGFLGTALRRALADQCHDIIRLVRRPAGGPDESTWDPYRDELDQSVVDAADVVINLAGSPTAGNPHSKKWARELRESRVTTTRVLAAGVASSVRAGSPTVFLAGSAVGYYGDHGDQLLDEGADSRGEGVMTAVVRDWEAATQAASAAGARVCRLRTSPVIDRSSEPLKQLLPLFRIGLGARLGDERQYFPLISLRDWVGGVSHLTTSETSGPVNLCCPITPTNTEFTTALADAVKRRARLAVPKKVLEVAGDAASQILGSMRTRPAVLVGSGYQFQDADVRDVIAAALHS